MRISLDWRNSAAITALSVLVGTTAAAVPVPAAVARYAAPQLSVRLADGRRFNFVCMGQGSPTAILDVGLGDWSLAWRDVLPKLGRITRTCIADRAGYGFSDPGPLPRDAIAETKDLEGALAAARMRGPFVMIGHSLGGLNARLFAYRNPTKVAGLLLIDPSVSFREFGARADFARKMGLPSLQHCLEQAQAGKLRPGDPNDNDEASCVPAPDPRWSAGTARRITALRSRPSVFATKLAEFASAYDVDVEEVDAARHSLGSIPLLVLTEDKAHFQALRSWFADDAGAVYARWVAGHDDEARDSTRGENQIVAGAGHDIQEDRPDAVIRAFRKIVEAERQSADRRRTAAGPPRS